MITREEYEAYIAKLSDKPCGVGFGPKTSVKDCRPPSQDNRRCGICGHLIYKSDTGEK